LQGGGLVGPEEIPSSILTRMEIGESLSGPLVLQVPPNPLKRMEFRAGGGHPDISDLVRPAEGSRGRSTAVVQAQEVQAVRKGLGKGLDAKLERLGVQGGQCQEDALARRRRHRAVDGAPLEAVLYGAHGLHSTRGETPSTYRQ
jgi:hypothetical protein